MCKVVCWLENGPGALQQIVPKQVRVRDLAGCMPDQKGWIESLCGDRSETLTAFMRRLEYDDVCPLITMWPCIVLCTEVLQSNIIEVAQDKLALTISDFWKQSNGVALHPSRLSGPI